MYNIMLGQVNQNLDFLGNQKGRIFYVQKIIKFEIKIFEFSERNVYIQITVTYLSMVIEAVCWSSSVDTIF